ILLVQRTAGYEGGRVIQLMFLWCSMPRLAWLTILLIGVQPFGVMKFSAAASLLLAEIILQSLSSCYKVMAVNYGREHNFYFGGMERAERGRSAKTMYTGAHLWLMIVGLVLIQSMQATRRVNGLIGSGQPTKVAERQADNIKNCGGS